MMPIRGNIFKGRLSCPEETISRAHGQGLLGAARPVCQYRSKTKRYKDLES